MLGVQCGCAWGQSTEGEVAARLMGKPLQLRGFWMDDKLKFDASGKPVSVATEGSFTESAFDAKKVTLQGDQLKIEGQRVGLKFEKDGTMKRLPIIRSGVFKKAPETIMIEIDGHGNTDFRKALDAIFADSLAELTPSLRPYWQAYARKHFLNETTPAPSPKQGVSEIGGQVKPPHVLHSVDPSFSEFARDLKVSGYTLISLVLDEQGHATEFSIVKPLGLGLDERAIAAIVNYQFAPATRDGVPVKVAISIDVNFQIF